jgi:hypothetical protein
MLRKLIDKFFGKSEPAKPPVKAKRPLREDEILAKKLAKMTEYEREIFYYEQANKADYRSPLEIAMQATEAKQKNYVARFEFSPNRQNFINVRSYCAFREKSADDTGFERAKKRVMGIGGKAYLWTYIRNKLEENAGHRCVLCGGSGLDQGGKTHTEAHEQWIYEKVTLKTDRWFINGNKVYKLSAGKTVYVQRLFDIQSLCYVCHQIKHYNRWFSKEDEKTRQILKECYMLQNDVDEPQFEKDLAYAYDKQKLIDRTYLLDISALFEIAQKAGFDNSAIEQLKEYEVDKLFNCHSETFQTFLNREFISTGEKDEG